MSGPNFTPGPWRVEWDLDETNDFNFPYAIRASVLDENGKQITVTHPDGLRNEDAVLIAAAPDLYEALVRALCVVESLAQDIPFSGEAARRLLPDVLAALARARGAS